MTSAMASAMRRHSPVNLLFWRLMEVMLVSDENDSGSVPLMPLW
jgi:hypothetical protein